MFFEVTGGPLGRIWRAPRGSRRHSWTLPTTFPLVVGLYTTLAWMKRDQTQHVSDVDDTLPSQHRILGVGHFKRAQVDHSSLAPKLAAYQRSSCPPERNCGIGSFGWKQSYPMTAQWIWAGSESLIFPKARLRLASTAFEVKGLRRSHAALDLRLEYRR